MDLEIYLQTRATKTITDAYAVETIRARLEGYERYLDQLTVRFADAMNARGRIDKVCRVHVALRGLGEGAPTFIVEGRAPHERAAAALAAEDVKAAIDERLPRRVARAPEEATVIVEGAPIASERDGVTPRRLRAAHPQRKRHLHKTQRQSHATAAREPHAPSARPSRKLTRKSANRMKRDSQQEIAVTRRARAPESRARRATRRGALSE